MTKRKARHNSKQENWCILHPTVKTSKTTLLDKFDAACSFSSSKPWLQLHRSAIKAQYIATIFFQIKFLHFHKAESSPSGLFTTKSKVFVLLVINMNNCECRTDIHYNVDCMISSTHGQHVLLYVCTMTIQCKLKKIWVPLPLAAAAQMIRASLGAR